MLVVAFLIGLAERPLPGLVQPALRRARATRAVDRGRVDHAREPRSFVRRRAEHRRPARAGHLGAGDARRRRVLLRRLGPLPPERRGRGARARGPGQGPCRRGRALGVRQPDRPRGARRHGDDQLLQLRLRRALHPLCEPVARRRAGDARARARRRRGRRRPGRGRDGSNCPQDRGRPDVRRGLRRLPGAAPPRPARRGAALGHPRLPLPRRVRRRARRDDARHQRRRDLRRR